jgi:MFS family permease
LVGKIGSRIPLIVGACFATIGFFCYSLIGIGGSYWTTFFPAACILGIAGTFFVTPLTTGVMSALDNSHAGIASGLNNTISRIAGLLAIAILGLILSQTFYRSFDKKILSQHLSLSTLAVLDEQRQSLAAGRPPIHLKEADATIVGQDVKESYTRGFQIVMRFSACLSAIAALTILIRNE